MAKALEVCVFLVFIQTLYAASKNRYEYVLDGKVLINPKLQGSPEIVHNELENKNPAINYEIKFISKETPNASTDPQLYPLTKEFESITKETSNTSADSQLYPLEHERKKRDTPTKRNLGNALGSPLLAQMVKDLPPSFKGLVADLAKREPPTAPLPQPTPESGNTILPKPTDPAPIVPPQPPITNPNKTLLADTKQSGLANQIEEAAKSKDSKQLLALAENLENTDCETYTVDYIMSATLYGIILRLIYTLAEILTFGSLNSYATYIIAIYAGSYLIRQFFGIDILQLLLNAFLDLITGRLNLQSGLLLALILYHLYTVFYN